MLKKSKKIVSLVLAVVICFTLPLSVFAASETFGVDTSKGFIDLTMRGWQGATVTSNPVYFTVNAGDKVIKSITVQVGTSTTSGTIVGKSMTLENITTGRIGTTAWAGGNNTSVTFNTTNSDFVGTPASGTYMLKVQGLVISNTLGNPIFGTPDMEAIRGYKGSQIKLIIEYA